MWPVVTLPCRCSRRFTIETNLPDEPPLTVRWGLVALWVSAICHLPGRVNVRLGFPAVLAPWFGPPNALTHGIAVLVAFIILVSPLLLTWLVARGIGRRQGWARIVVLAVFGVSLPFRVIWLIDNSDLNWPTLETLVLLCLDTYVVLSLFTAEGGVWFRSKSAAATGIGAS
jgi:hypothetical protein